MKWTSGAMEGEAGCDGNGTGQGRAIKETPRGYQSSLWSSGAWLPHVWGRNAFLINLFVSWLLPKTQLLELRTNNYQLSDELRKNGVGEPRESH